MEKEKKFASHGHERTQCDMDYINDFLLRQENKLNQAFGSLVHKEGKTLQ